MNIKERQRELAHILKSRGLVDEGCDCGHWRSEHDDIPEPGALAAAIGHGHCLMCNCEKYRWNPNMKLKCGQEKRVLFEEIEVDAPFSLKLLSLKDVTASTADHPEYSPCPKCKSAELWIKPTPKQLSCFDVTCIDCGHKMTIDLSHKTYSHWKQMRNDAIRAWNIACTVIAHEASIGEPT